MRHIGCVRPTDWICAVRVAQASTLGTDAVVIAGAGPAITRPRMRKLVPSLPKTQRREAAPPFAGRSPYTQSPYVLERPKNGALLLSAACPVSGVMLESCTAALGRAWS